MTALSPCLCRVELKPERLDTRYETIEESDLVILLISDSAMASNHEKVFSKLKKVGYVKERTKR